MQISGVWSSVLQSFPPINPFFILALRRRSHPSMCLQFLSRCWWGHFILLHCLPKYEVSIMTGSLWFSNLRQKLVEERNMEVNLISPHFVFCCLCNAMSCIFTSSFSFSGSKWRTRFFVRYGGWCCVVFFQFPSSCLLYHPPDLKPQIFPRGRIGSSY